MSKPKKITRQPSLKVVSTLENAQLSSLDRYKSEYDKNPKVDWDKTTLWKITTEGDRGFIILRYVRFKDKTSIKERLDRSIYAHQKDKKEVCEEICRILNTRTEARRKASEAWLVKSAFIKVQGSELSKKFEIYMTARSGNVKHARQCVRIVENHFLNYFYYERSEPLFDYLEWVSLKVQAEYIDYLFSKKIESTRMGRQKATLASKTIKSIIQYINHFMKFIHQESDGHIPLLQFTFPSVTNARFVDHTIKRKKGLKIAPKPSEQYIDEATFKKIFKQAPDNLKSAIWFAYNFGLRRSEVLGLDASCIKKTHIKVMVQLTGLDIERDEQGQRVSIKEKKTSPLKNRDEAGRKIPYWYTTPEETYKMLQKLYVCHPSGLSEAWIALMKEMDLNFTFHNLRNAFCSNALRDTQKLKISPTDVQLALGHSDIRTSMIYLRDYRELDDDEEWTPSNVG